MTNQSIDALELIQPLFDLLTRGDIPEDVNIKTPPPEMSSEQAFSLIWFLQEVMHVLPDTVELCVSCGNIFDHATGGHIIAWDGDLDDWYQTQGITEEMIRTNEGITVCSDTCEGSFWKKIKRAEALDAHSI